MVCFPKDNRRERAQTGCTDHDSRPGAERLSGRYRNRSRRRVVRVGGGGGEKDDDDDVSGVGGEGCLVRVVWC